MEIELKTRSIIAEIIIKSGNTKIEEDISVFNKGKAHIPDADIEKFVTIARDMNIFNGKSDIDFVKMIYDAFLSDSERELFIEEVLQQQQVIGSLPPTYAEIESAALLHEEQNSNNFKMSASDDFKAGVEWLKLKMLSGGIQY